MPDQTPTRYPPAALLPVSHRTQSRPRLPQARRHKAHRRHGRAGHGQPAGYTARGDDSTFEQVASNEEFALFCEAVRHLPVKCRRVFVLKKVYGYSQIEIAKKLNISIGTVEKHISQGIKRCTYFMQQHSSTEDGLKKGLEQGGHQQPNSAIISLADRAPRGPRS